MNIPFRRLPGADDINTPRYHSDGAAGLDLHAAVAGAESLAPGEVRLIPCGIAVAIPAGYEGQVRPRSGLAVKHGVTVLNAPGTVDSDYRGEIKVALVNHGTQPFVIERGARIAQLVVAAVVRATLQEVDQLPDTVRGAGGFGHTGA